MYELTSVEINQVEIMNMLDNLIQEIKDFKSVIVILLGFVIGYMIMKDFLNNVLRW